MWVSRERREELTPVCLLAVRGRVQGKERWYLVPIRRGVDKDEMLYPPKGVRLSLRKKGSPATCDNIDEAGGHDAKWTKPVTEGHITAGSHLDEE